LKAKKAAKRLSKAEALLSSVLDGYAADTAELREPLQEAVAAVRRVRSAVDSNRSSGNPQTAAKSRPAARKPDPGNVDTARKRSVAGRNRRQGNQRATRNSQTPMTQNAEIKKQASPVGRRRAKQIPASDATTQAAASS